MREIDRGIERREGECRGVERYKGILRGDKIQRLAPTRLLSRGGQRQACLVVGATTGDREDKQSDEWDVSGSSCGIQVNRSNRQTGSQTKFFSTFNHNAPEATSPPPHRKK